MRWGLGLYLQGSKSPYLKKGIEVLQEVADQHKDSMLGAQINMALAQGAARPFFRVTDPRTGTMKKSAEADPEEALRLTDPALKLLQRQKQQWSNLPYQRVVRRRAKYHQAAGTPEQAKKELSHAKEVLADRGVHKAGLKRTAELESKIAESVAKASRTRRVAARKGPRTRPRTKPKRKRPGARRPKPKPA